MLVLIFAYSIGVISNHKHFVLFICFLSVRALPVHNRVRLLSHLE